MIQYFDALRIAKFLLISVTVMGCSIEQPAHFDNPSDASLERRYEKHFRTGVLITDSTREEEICIRFRDPLYLIKDEADSCKLRKKANGGNIESKDGACIVQWNSTDNKYILEIHCAQAGGEPCFDDATDTLVATIDSNSELLANESELSSKDSSKKWLVKNCF